MDLRPGGREGWGDDLPSGPVGYEMNTVSERCDYYCPQQVEISLSCYTATQIHPHYMTLQSDLLPAATSLSCCTATQVHPHCMTLQSDLPPAATSLSCVILLHKYINTAWHYSVTSYQRPLAYCVSYCDKNTSTHDITVWLNTSLSCHTATEMYHTTPIFVKWFWRENDLIKHARETTVLLSPSNEGDISVVSRKNKHEINTTIFMI